MAQEHLLPPPSPLPQFRRRPTFRNTKTFWIPLVTIVIFLSIFFTPLPRTYDQHRDAVIQSITDSAKDVLPPVLSHDKWHPTDLDNVKAKYAFATFLAGNADQDENWENDHYFIATRILAYQLLHAPETSSRDKSIPFVVLVTENVSEQKRQRLRKDGAVVVAADFIRSDWVKTETSTWQDVMTKLRLWELEQFERICFLDGDTVLVEPLDAIFADPAVETRGTLTQPAATLADEGAMPLEYSFAGVPEMMRDHGYPPTDEHHDYPNYGYLNAGFFVFKPSRAIFDYYMSLLKLDGRFNPQFPEQNLLNYAHRDKGNMPWTHLGNEWNIHYPKVDDLLGGVKSLHDKWWSPEVQDLKPYMESWRWRMEGHYEARDQMLTKDYQKHGLKQES
jgi:alpha-N-acetylglucosamine transferase